MYLHFYGCVSRRVFLFPVLANAVSRACARHLTERAMILPFSFLEKKQFVSELELISQLSVPNAVIGPISLCFLQLASSSTEKKRGGENEIERERWGGRWVHYISVGACGVLANLAPGGKNHLRWGSRRREVLTGR